MTDWHWLSIGTAIAVHDRQLAEHGGPEGVRDPGGLESALARPVNLAAYGEPDLAALAAAYASGVARNHPFIDGNKRTAWVLARLFVVLNDGNLQFEAADAIAIMLRVAAGAVTETDVAAWFRERLSPLP